MKEQIAGEEKPSEQEKPAGDNFTDVALGFDPFEVQGAENAAESRSEREDAGVEKSMQENSDEAEAREEDVKDITEGELDIF